MRRDDTHKTEKPGIERRNLLKGLGIGAAGVAAATLANTAVPTEAATAKADTVSREYERKARYQDNAHVERFYALNRL